MIGQKKITAAKLLMYFAVALFAAACIIPMLLVLIVSFTDESVIEQYGYQFFPQKLSLEADRLIFTGGSSVLRALGMSVLVTLTGTFCAVLITAGAAYTLANKDVKYRNTLALFFFIPTIISSGIVPWYLVCRQLHLQNNFFALIIPNLLFSPFNMFLVRNFMSSIPDALRESAKLDGANDAVIAFRIYLPLCLPVIATITLFYGLAYWNDWWNAIMLVDNVDMYPLQYLLMKLQSQIQMINDLGLNAGIVNQMSLPSESMKMATAVVTIGPIVLLYPFLQKYFVSGLTIGSVKG